MIDGTYAKLSGIRIIFFISFLAITSSTVIGDGAVITISPGESIQDAVDKANPGDIIEIMSGYYEGGIYLDKPLYLRGREVLRKPVIIETQNRGSAVVLDADGCSLERLKIMNSKGCGIYVSSDFNNISNNNIVAQTGIYLEECQGNRVASNFAFGGWLLGAGIELSQSYNNSLVKNTAFGGWISSAIQLSDGSNNNTIIDNFASDNGWGDGINLRGSCDNLILSNLALTDSSVLGANGICIGWGSSNNTLQGNTAIGSGWKGNGIYLLSSDKNTIAYNNISSKGNSESDGIFLSNSDNNTLLGNNVSYNHDYGIDLLHSCDNNTIMKNIVGNNAKGIFIQGYNNTIYLNDFINNGQSAYSWDPSTRWYSPKPVNYQFDSRDLKNYLGNRWSDYKGIDSSGDGVGDEPYHLQDGQDNYPLTSICEKYAIKFME
jgi:nitrous oxidase accessory protein